MAKSKPVPGHPHLRYAGGAASPKEEHISSLLLDRLEKLAEATGKTLTIFSGSGGPSVRGGAGFPGDPHARGIAADVSAGGRPIGEVIPVRTIEAFGIRSGDVKGFYKGKPDAAHVDLVGEPGRAQTVRGNVGKGWEAALLHSIGAPVTPGNIRFLNLWHDLEGGSAHFNPLNTTQGAAGATNYNSVGVKNYRTASQGVTATARTLKNGHYPTILAALRSGQPGRYLAVKNHSAQAQKEAGVWGTGGHLITEFQSGKGGGGFSLGLAASYAEGFLIGKGSHAGAFRTSPFPAAAAQETTHKLGYSTPIDWLNALSNNWKRIGMVIIGGLMLLIGIVLLARQSEAGSAGLKAASKGAIK